MPLTHMNMRSHTYLPTSCSKYSHINIKTWIDSLACFFFFFFFAGRIKQTTESRKEHETTSRAPSTCIIIILAAFALDKRTRAARYFSAFLLFARSQPAPFFIQLKPELRSIFASRGRSAAASWSSLELLKRSMEEPRRMRVFHSLKRSPRQSQQRSGSIFIAHLCASCGQRRRIECNAQTGIFWEFANRIRITGRRDAMNWW